MMKKILGMIVLLFCGMVVNAAKVAVIADKGLEKYADLLTVELSKQSDLNVIERTEIDRVLKEQAISSANLTANYLKLGKLLKADGLVIIRKFEFQKKEFLVSRLVAVNQGAVLSAFSNPFPPEKNDNWSADISAKFAPYLNKLNVSPDKAVPISILNIRAPIDTPEMRLLEKEFTLALAFRLVQEKDLFVLERWKMEKLAWEKDIDTESSPFWTGSYLLDGNIELVDKENVKIKVRLRMPTGLEKTIEAAGTKDRLSEITEKVTGDLLKKIGKAQDRIMWDSTKEAEQYLKEAEWAFNAGLFEDAFSSVQTSIALGNKSEVALFLEVKAATNCAYPAREPEVWIKINFGYESNLIDITKDSRRIDDALLSMELLRKSILDKIPESGQSFSSEKKWRELAERTLLNASIVLRAYYDQGCISKDSGKTSALRKMIRDSYPVIAGRYFNYGLTANVFEIKASYIPFWCDSPEETLDAYRDLLCNNHIKDARQYYYEIKRTLIVKDVLKEMTMFRASAWQGLRMERADDPSRTPFLIDWQGRIDKKMLMGMWDNFTDNLCASGDLKARYAGLYIKAWTHNLSAAKGGNKYMRELMDLCWKERANIVEGKSDIPVFSADGFNIAAVDKDAVYQYLSKYVKFLLEESISGKIAKHSGNLPDVFSVWLKDSTPADADAVFSLLMKYRDTIKESLKGKGIYDFTISYNNQILKKYPQLCDSGTKNLLISRIWNPYESKVTNDLSGFQILHISGLASGVSLICSYDSKDAVTFKIAFISSNGLENSFMDIPYENISSMVAADVSENFAVIARGRGALLSYDIKSGKWSEYDMFEKKYTSVKIIGETAFISFNPSESGNLDSGIIKLNLKSGKSEILASSGRNPAQSPLDNLPPYKVEEIMEISPGIVLVAVTLKDKPYFPQCLTYDVANDRWGELFLAEEKLLRGLFKHKISLEFLSEGGDFYGRYTFGGFMVLLSDMNYQKTIYLHYNNARELPVIFNGLREWKSFGKYLFPANKYLCYDGSSAFYYTGNQENIACKYLIAFPDKSTDGIAIKLEFNMDDQLFSLMSAKNRGIDRKEAFFNNAISDNCFWLKGSGFFIKSGDSRVLWFIPQRDIDDYISKGIGDRKIKQ
ncbi:MAG: hypothetical protein WCS96_00315 [Victivallales bacterium]|jgi:hypothetical protein